MTTPTSIEFLPLSSAIISTDTGSPTRFSVTNNTNGALSLYWIDRSGAEILYAELLPGQSKVQPTTSSHAWELKGPGGATGFKFFPTLAGSITVQDIAAPLFTDYSEKVSYTALGEWSTAQGYGLINVAASLGIEDLGATLPVNAQSNNLALNAISASSAWAAGYTGKGVKVAIVDVGIAAHPEIDARIVGGHDFFDNDDTPAPDGGSYSDHALAVASIIAASHLRHGGQDTMGLAPDVQLLNVRVGSGATGSSTDNIAAGIRYAVDSGAKVISMPLQNLEAGVPQSLIDAVHYAYTHNVVMVIAGGNYSSYGPTGPAMVAQLSGESLDVGNFNALSASPFDSSNQPGANPFPWVMASSSGFVPNPAGGYTFHEDGGTSFAGPYVAALAALLFEQSPGATAREIIDRIIHGATISENEATEAARNFTYVNGSAASDQLSGTGSNEVFDGANGLDLVRFSGERGDYNIQKSGGAFTVKDNGAHDGSDAVINIERLVFADGNVALDIDGAAGQVYRLYRAAFGREADKAGLGYWIAANDHGMSISSIAAQFVASAESKALYGENPSHAALINAVYQNVLGRAPDPAGYEFWLTTLTAGSNTPAALVTAFGESAENKAALVGVIGNGFDYLPFG